MSRNADTAVAEASDRLRDVARTYIWWSPPETSLQNLDRLIAQVMALGTWDDAMWLLDRVGPRRFIGVLNSPPPGILSPKSWTFWHVRLLGAEPSAPLPTGRHIP